MFSKQYYNTIAKILNNLYKFKYLDKDYNTGYHEAIEDTVIELADYIAPNNPCFEKDKFIKDCGIGE